MTVASVSRTTGNAATETVLDRDVSPIIWHVGEPTESPLVTLTGGDLYLDGKEKPQKVAGKISREKTTQINYEVIEKDPLARTVTTAAAVTDTTTTTVVLASNANCRVGDTMRSKETGEVVLVYAVDSGGANLSVRRNLGSTAFQIGSGDTFVIMGYGSRQGGAKASMKSQLAAARIRYVQTFKRSFGITRTLDASQSIVSQHDFWGEEMSQALVEHKKDIEFSFWFNSAADSTTDASAYTLYFTRGILAELASYTTNPQAAVSEDDFFGPIAEDIFEFGPTRKTAFVDSRCKSVINQFSRVKLQTKPEMNKYGMNVTTVETGHGLLDIVSCGVFDKFLSDDEKGMMVVLDLERIGYRYLEGRDTMYEDMIQTPGDDAREAQYISECGVSVKSLSHHRVIRNFA